MGGKTQQRVAGNVKPSSSGRIRELLVNKHGVGNPFINFSALSSNVKKSSQKPEIIQTENPKEKISKESDDKVPANSNSVDKPVLVLKRVGNREFFVKVDKNNAEQKDIVSTETLFNTKAPKQEEPDDNEAEKSQIDTHHPEQEDETTDASGNDSDDEELSDASKFGFEEILDRLDDIRNSIDMTVKTISQLDDSSVENELKLVNYLHLLTRKFQHELSIEEWDLIIQSIVRWVSILFRTEILIGLPTTKSQLCNRIIKFIYNLKLVAQSFNKDGSAEDQPMLGTLVDDWFNFCKSKAYRDLLSVYFKMAEVEILSDNDESLIDSMTSIMLDTDPNFIGTCLCLPKPAPVELDPEFKLPKDVTFCMMNQDTDRLFLNICNLIKKNKRSFIILGHSMMQSYLPSTCANLLINIDNNTENIMLLPVEPLFAIMASRDSLVSALLSDYRAGDISVTIEPKSDSYSCVLSYLVIWDLIILFIINVGKEAGHSLIHSLKKLGFIGRLLDNIFMLLPPPSENLNAGPNFLKDKLQLSVSRAKNEIDLVALHVFFSVACHMPVTVRKWYNNNSNKRLCNLVNEYTVKHVSQAICSQEMDSVLAKCQQRADEDKSINLTIKARPNSREVYAIYTRDEFKMELTIKLPSNYPLGSVQIDGGKRIGVTDLKWRSWLLQLTRFLAHQNGPLLDGIDLWRRNIDKRFEGVEKCMICFSILHSNYQLPKRRCQTCAKMFHNFCLYKWFESSGNSTCPLCRNIW